jgi:hypothetical protein
MDILGFIEAMYCSKLMITAMCNQHDLCPSAFRNDICFHLIASVGSNRLGKFAGNEHDYQNKALTQLFQRSGIPSSSRQNPTLSCILCVLSVTLHNFFSGKNLVPGSEYDRPCCMITQNSMELDGKYNSVAGYSLS